MRIKKRALRIRQFLRKKTVTHPQRIDQLLPKLRKAISQKSHIQKKPPGFFDH